MPEANRIGKSQRPVINPRVLIVEAHPSVALTRLRQCRHLGWCGRIVHTPAALLEILDEWSPKAVVYGLVLPDPAAVSVFERLAAKRPDLPVLCVVDASTADSTDALAALADLDLGLDLRPTTNPLRQPTLAAFLRGLT